MSTEPVTRQCGRCRKHFPVDAGVHPMELNDWWTCPTCATALMPGRKRSATPAEATAPPSSSSTGGSS